MARRAGIWGTFWQIPIFVFLGNGTNVTRNSGQTQISNTFCRVTGMELLGRLGSSCWINNYLSGFWVGSGKKSNTEMQRPFDPQEGAAVPLRKTIWECPSRYAQLGSSSMFVFSVSGALGGCVCRRSRSGKWPLLSHGGPVHFLLSFSSNRNKEVFAFLFFSLPSSVKCPTLPGEELRRTHNPWPPRVKKKTKKTELIKL